MSGDNCRWFNKNGFALGTGECVLHRRVCGSGHEVCEQYEEYGPRPHGEWIRVIGCDGRTIAYKCKTCGWFKPHNIMPFCENCGADMRKRGDQK